MEDRGELAVASAWQRSAMMLWIEVERLSDTLWIE
jgi:hypothetical protein